MKEENKKVEFIKNCILIVIIAIIAFSAIFTNSISNLDEIWNFNFARNIADGLVPYKDFNIVQMPLVSMICGLFLKIFGTEIIVMRSLAVILMCAIFFIGDKVLKKLVPENAAFLVTAIFLFLFKDVMCIDYNYAVLLIALIMMLIELNHNKKDMFEYDFKYNFCLGLLGGLAILCKQTTGFAVAAACTGYKIFAIRKKEDIQPFFKIAFTRLLGFCIPVLIFVIYLLSNNAFSDFVDYAILGIKTFSNKIEYTNLFKIELVSYLSVVVPIALVVFFVSLFRKNAKYEEYVIFAYAISTFIVVFPISDQIHFLIGAMISIIGIVYWIYESFQNGREELFGKRIKVACYVVINFLAVFALLLLTWNSILKINKEYISVKKETELAHFKGVPEDEGLKEMIQIVDDYILEKQSEGKKVYILDSTAGIYYIPLNQYNKDYDMFLKGNLGGKGEDGIIERIDTEENAIYLLKKSGLNWQNPGDVRNYIIDNLEYSEDVLCFWTFNSKI